MKKQTEKAVLELLSEVQTCTAFDTESLKYTLKQVNATRSKLVSLRKINTPTPTISLKCNEPSNKNIEKQRRFYSTEKKRKEKKVRLVKPTRDEKDELFRSGYEWLDKLKINISKVTTEDSPLLSMVSRVSYDSMKNIISYKRKNLSSCISVPKKAKTDADSKISIIVLPDKGKFYFAKQKKNPLLVL